MCVCVCVCVCVFYWEFLAKMESGQLILTKSSLELPTTAGGERGRQLWGEALFPPLGRMRV